MNKKLILVTVTLVLLGMIALVALVAGLRKYQRKAFQRHRWLQTDRGVHYMLRLMETTVGKTECGYLLMVTVEIENSNSSVLRFPRREFVLKDGRGVLYEPAPTSVESLTPPARETFSFSLPTAALGNALDLRVSSHSWVRLRSSRPYTTQLREGEFRTYYRPDW